MAEAEEFIIQKRLGKGGFGEVFKVTWNLDGGTYALKKINIFGGAINIVSFLKEVTFLKSIDHPNIVEFYNAKCIDLQLAIQMEYCENGDMDSLIARRNGRRFHSQTMHKWMIELCSAIAYLHANGVMHRDLKPANILLDKTGNIKICDFGIAKIVLETCAETRIGTPIFMAPETICGMYNKEADIYSLGCALICMATVNGIPKDASGSFIPLPPKITYGETKNSIIERCVSHQKDDRPTALEIYSTLLDDNYETLRFCERSSVNCNISTNGLAAGQRESENTGGMVFSNRCLSPNEKFTLYIRKVEKEELSKFRFFFTEQDPTRISIDRATNQSPGENFIEKSHYCSCQAMFKKNTLLSFWYDECGTVRWQYNGTIYRDDEEKLPANRKFWVAVLLFDNILEVQLTDYD